MKSGFGMCLGGVGRRPVNDYEGSWGERFEATVHIGESSRMAIGSEGCGSASRFVKDGGLWAQRMGSQWFKGA